jgi:type I restriction enzyme S subunit
MADYVSLKDQRLMKVTLPDIDIQRAIARILGALDDKIELNRKMNQTLEAMAQSLFKSWFVNFDPVITKMEGRRPYGMDSEMAALFPDKLVESEIGPVPEGWKVSTIGSEVKVVGGSTPSTAEAKYWENGTINWITPRDLSKLIDPIVLDTDRRITEAGLKQISSGLLPRGTVLMSSRAPIGYLAIAEIPVAVNQGFIAMICNGSLPNHYVLLWVQENMEEVLSRSGGTTFGEISKTNFRPIPVIVPRKEILEAYEQRARTLFNRLVLNLKETTTLISARDTLLPKLLSGELRVKEMEQIEKQL